MEARYAVIGAILDRYEEHSKDWMGYRDQAGNRSLPVTQKLYDEVGRGRLNQEVLALEKEGLVRGKWYAHGSELERIGYSLKDMPRFYACDGRQPKAERVEGYRKELEAILQDDSLQDWIRSCFTVLLDALGKGRIPEEYGWEEEKRVLYFRTLLALGTLKEPTYRRVFGRQYLGSSKAFGKKLQARILSDARRFHPDVDPDPDVMHDDEALSQLYLETYNQELQIKGPLRLMLDGRPLDLSAFRYGAVLNADTMKHADIPGEQPIRKVVTVENKANFMAAPYEEGCLLIYTHGFFSPKERDFLNRLREALDGGRAEGSEDSCPVISADKSKSGVRYYHTGDLDYGGIRIYQSIQEKIFPGLQPLWMDRATFFQHLEDGEKREEAYLSKLRSLTVPEELQELKDCILDTGCTIEQESLL